MTKHYTYGGSTIARTIKCPAWVNVAKDLPKGKSSDAADEGTLLHNCMEDWLMKDKQPDDMLGTTYKQIELTPDLLNDKLLPAINSMEDVLKLFDIEDYICEPFVSLAPDVGGSIDFIGRSADGKQVLLVDYKFGFHPVSATDNKQLLFYALCASLDPATEHLFEGVDFIGMYIIQPTTDSGMSGSIVIPEELDDFETEVARAIRLSKKPDAIAATGDHCKFCPAMPTCALKTGKALKAKTMDPTQLATMAEMLALAEELEPWIKKVKTVAHEQMELGAKVEGYKLVNKRAMRVWNDKALVGDTIRKAKKIKLEEGFDMKLKTPAQLEKLCKVKGVDFKKYESYVSSVSSGTTLAKADDARPEVKITSDQLEELTKLI